MLHAALIPAIPATSAVEAGGIAGWLVVYCACVFEIAPGIIRHLREVGLAERLLAIGADTARRLRERYRRADHGAVTRRG